MTAVEGPMNASDGPMALSERIRAILQVHAPPPDDLSALILETEQTLAQAQTDKERAEVIFLDPLMPSDVVQQARGQVSEWTFVIQRLSAGLDHLKAKLEAVQAWLKEKARAEEVEQVTKDRDALAAELSETYPVLAHQLADLLQRLEDHAKETAKVGVPDAETVARNLPGNGRIGGMPVTSLSRLMRLPAFDPSDEVSGQSIWPRPAQRPQQHGSLEIPRLIKRMAPQLA